MASEILIRDKIAFVQTLELSADQLISALLRLSENETVCILDSCGVGHLGSHLLIAGIDPIETLEISNEDPGETLALLDKKFADDLACIFTISYDFGMKLLGISPSVRTILSPTEPDLFLAIFDSLVIHDYETGKTKAIGNAEKYDSVSKKLAPEHFKAEILDSSASIASNFSRAEYLAAIETIKERIRRGDTYQTNLSQQLSASLPAGLSTQTVFQRLRKQHPAPFAAYMKRLDSTVISASPERFFRVDSLANRVGSRRKITTSPVKGTRPRGNTKEQDDELRTELLTSQKDRAENTMIVDLLRNDLGRVCKYGSVQVEKLCDLEEHPTLFHLVSTISGDLCDDAKFSDILRAVFPCGSITGAPKISTMRIIDELETADRGLSMGAIGYWALSPNFQFPGQNLTSETGLGTCDLSVAIRTMVIRDNVATFNVGGGVVIDSDPEKEYDESLLKALALIGALEAGQVQNTK